MRRENRIAFVVAAIVCLPLAWFYAIAPTIAFLIWVGPMWTCDANCPDMDWLFTTLDVAAIVSYAILLVLGAWWAARAPTK